MSFNNIHIRQAKVEDALSIAHLSQQLGYSISIETIQIYLKSLETAKEWIVYIAYQPENLILGWINVYLTHGILADRQAEIGGLIVEQNFRGKGVGRQLIQQAHLWAREKGCSLIQVRSQITRQQAHAFYQNIGYKSAKTQLVLHKQLNID